MFLNDVCPIYYGKKKIKSIHHSMEKAKTLECYKLSDKFMYYLSNSRVCALHQNILQIWWRHCD